MMVLLHDLILSIASSLAIYTNWYHDTNKGLSQRRIYGNPEYVCSNFLLFVYL